MCLLRPFTLSWPSCWLYTIVAPELLSLAPSCA
ncbi:hypothetical protein GLYMA_14G207651v4 [Glycine max]|nr:hypothetical protein GLYMA_14G207651v4 [Glycine max]